VFPLVLHHLQDQLDLVDVVNEVAFQCHAILVLLPYLPQFLTVETSIELAKQVCADVVHSLGFPPVFLRFGYVVHGRNVAHKSLSHIMDERHLCASQDIELRGDRLGGHHGEDTHAVHVVGDGFSIVDSKSDPARSFGGLQSLKEVEERDWRRCVFGVLRSDFGDNCDEGTDQRSSLE
jgi:hypothetical protein